MLISLDKCRGYGLFLMRVSYPGCSGPVASGVGVVVVVLIAGKAIDTIPIVGELGVLIWVGLGLVEFVAFLIVGKCAVFWVGCFSSRDDR